LPKRGRFYGATREKLENIAVPGMIQIRHSVGPVVQFATSRRFQFMSISQKPESAGKEDRSLPVTARLEAIIEKYGQDVSARR
jgi:hypothetical protein